MASVLAAFALLAAAPPPEDVRFLDFPMATATAAAARAPVFAWLVRRGERSVVMTAAAPAFRPRAVIERDDHDGDPITAVALSPDGGALAFQTGAAAEGESAYNPAGLVPEPKTQVWTLDLAPGAQARLVGPGTRPGFAPDGALTYRREGVLRRGEKAIGAGFADIDWAADGRSFVFVRDRGGYALLGRYVLGEDRVTWLVSGADRLSTPRLSPDGRTVAFRRFPGREHGRTYDQTAAEPMTVETVPLAGGAGRVLWRASALSGVPDGDSALRWLDDGRVAVWAEADGWARLWAVPATGGAARPLTPPACETAESEALGNGRLLVVDNCGGDLDRRRLWLDGAGAVPTSDRVTALAAASSGFALMVGAGPDAPALARIIDVRTGRAVMRERAADYGFDPRFSAPAPRDVRFTAADGTALHGQLFEAAGPGPHPAIVYLHGGPRRQMFSAFHPMRTYAAQYAINRRLAELGYVVLSVNFRTGTGYGAAFREPAGWGWRRASEYQDVLAARAVLAGRDDVDPRRIGLWGASYGGYLTALGLARDSDLFSAGVAVHGVFDWSFSSDRPGHQNPSALFGVGDAERPDARAASPVRDIDRWRAPVLLLSGDQDMNVDVRETVDLARKLAARGVEARPVILPGEAHEFVRQEAWVRLWREQAAFFAETLGRETK